VVSTLILFVLCFIFQEMFRKKLGQYSTYLAWLGGAGLAALKDEPPWVFLIIYGVFWYLLLVSTAESNWKAGPFRRKHRNLWGAIGIVVGVAYLVRH